MKFNVRQTLQDPLQRNATIGFINNFGQIPKQLFKKPHPAKKVKLSKNNNADLALTDYKNIEKEGSFYQFQSTVTVTSLWRRRFISCFCFVQRHSF